MIVPLDPLLVLGNVLGVQEFAGGRVFAEAVFRHRAGVHERLRRHGQASVHDRRLVNVEHELGVFDYVYPESEEEEEEMEEEMEEEEEARVSLSYAKRRKRK